MKISLNWLNGYLDLKGLSVQDIAETLTNLGLEVESVDSICPLDEKVVVGKILEARPHPNADKLQVCSVDVGAKEPLVIVCGAPNARKDLWVAAAQVGSILPGDFKIKSSKIRGEKSQGMLCSEKELGLGAGDDGILELSDDLTLGKPLSQIYQLNDTVFEIGLTPNRSDCLGYLGIARDLAAKLETPLIMPEIPNELGTKSLKTSAKIQVDIQGGDGCARFTALYVEDVKALASPLWMQRQLENSGMRPINLIVDATNYVMLEAGHPIHAYDIRDISGEIINVRRASPGETLTTLDGQKRQLEETDLVIADGERAIGLAGVMGGENSEVKEDTTKIVIEVAHFNPSAVRKTSKRHNIHSEASHRFERGVDITRTGYVARRVAQLISQSMETACSVLPKISGELLDIYPEPLMAKKIALRTDRLRQITGLRSITQKECIKHLENLGFTFLDKKDDRALFEVPSWRLDVEREADLIEEVARLHGYDKIPYTLPMMEIGAIAEQPMINFLDECKYTIAAQGFSEIISFPFISPADLSAFNIYESHPFAATVSLANPLVEDQRLMRTSVLFGLLKAVVSNRKRGAKGVRLFEVARNFYHFNPSDQRDWGIWQHLEHNGQHIMGKARNDHRPIERNVLAAVLDQPVAEKSWQNPELEADFFHGKESLERFLGAMGLSDLSYESFEPDEIPWLHPGAAATVSRGSLLLGYVGELHPQTIKALDLNLNEAPIVIEIDLEQVLSAKEQKKTYRGASHKFPPTTRDLAFVVDKTVTHSDFCQAFKSFNRCKNLSSYGLFDVYEGDRLASDKKSMAFSLEFQSDKKTLTDSEVEKEVKALVDWFKQQLSAELR